MSGVAVALLVVVLVVQALTLVLLAVLAAYCHRTAHGVVAIGRVLLKAAMSKPAAGDQGRDDAAKGVLRL